MAFKHGKDAVFILGANNLSAFITNTALADNADSHDVTTYGNDSHRKFGGLKDGSITVDFIWDDGVTGPDTIVRPLLGTIVTFTYRPEGTGVGLPEITGNVLVQALSDTVPVADMITQSVALERDGDWVSGAQV